jgi:ATP-dependent DNA helicase RecG
VSGRSLAYLAGIPIERVQGLTGKRGANLRKAGIESVADLLMHVPRRYVDRSRLLPLGELPLGEEITVIGRVTKVSTRRPRRNLTIVEATIVDGSGLLVATWFNQGFRATQLAEGVEVALSGTVERYRGRLQMSSPDADVLDRPSESLTTGRVMPVHPTAGGVGPGHMRRAIHNALLRARPVTDPVPLGIRERLGLIDRDTAFADIHFPEEMGLIDPARNRLVFDEFFRLEVALAVRKHQQIQAAEGIAHSLDGGLVDEFIDVLPYVLTNAQRRVIAEIHGDMSSPHPMHRLLQGEVGSARTW